MKVKVLIALAAIVAVALPAQAKAATFGGIVVAKQPQRGTLVLAGRRAAGLTVRGATSRAMVGDRVGLKGLRLRDRTIRGQRLNVLSHTRRATIRGVVVRQLRSATLLATGHSVITIHRQSARRAASASDHGDLRAGSVAEFPSASTMTTRSKRRRSPRSVRLPTSRSRA